MKQKNLTRREFLATSTAGAGASALAGSTIPEIRIGRAGLPALLGGEPLRTKPFPRWPNWQDSDEQAILPVLRSGVWSRQKTVTEAERRFAALMGAPYCLATTNGTNAIITALRALGLGPGDEVITTPYTFVATIHPILLAGALPVFVDIDPQTWQIDPAKIEAKITRNTTVLLPVHILGGVCDMDRIGEIARKHRLRVVEDACEAHLAEWNGKKVGTLSDLGCFSFQNGKVLTCGEGGAVLGHDEKLMDLCYSFHNLGRPYGKTITRERFGFPIVASKCRMAEYQASILLTQMERVVEETKRRADNAAYLTSRLQEIRGIVPRQDYSKVTQKSYYYYGFRYKKEAFNGLSREKFVAALNAEGIPSSTGIGVLDKLPMHREGMIEDAFRSKTYKKIYAREKLAAYAKENECPLADRLSEETVGFHQRMLLGAKADIDDIAGAILKIQRNQDELAAA